MIELRRILLVDWYLFRVEQIDIAGMTSLIGPNGAGKSAVIDAMQTVLTGANMSSIRFNASAQASSKSKRSIRDYCLGVVSLDQKGEHSKPTREHAYTYAVLGFIDTETEKTINLGVAFSASAACADETTEALFLVRDYLLSKDDLLEPVGGDEVETRQWHAVRTLLRTKGVEVEDGFGSASEFVSEALRALSPPGYPLDARRFTRAFRNALMLKPVDNPTEFVRNYVLDVQPIQIERLRRSIDLYRSLTEKIKGLKAQSAALGQILGIVGRINENERAIRIAEWEIARIKWEQFRSEVRSLEAKLQTLSADTFKKEATALAAASKLSRLEADAARVDLALNASEPAQLARTYEAQRDAERNKRVNTAAPLALLNDLLTKISTLVDRRIVVGRDDTLQSLLEGAAQFAAVDLALWTRRLPEDWRSVAVELDVSLVSITSERLASIQKAIEKAYLSAKFEAQRLQDRLAGIDDNLKRLQEGRSIIEYGTRALITALRERGIGAEPLCDLVEVTQDKWRSAAEAALGRSREALIVDPDNAADALKIYRAGSEDAFSQAEVVNTTKTNVTRSADKGSLATVVATQNSHARAFLDFRLGRLAMVESVEALLEKDSAIIPDRMMHSGRTVRRLPPPVYLKLGRASAEETRRMLETERAELQRQLAEKGRTGNRLDEDRTLLADVVRGFEAIRAKELSYVAIGSTLEEADKRIAKLDGDIRDAHRRRDPKLVAEQLRINGEVGTAKSDKAVADKVLTEAQRAEDNTAGQYKQLKGSLANHRGERRAKARLLPMDATFLQELRKFQTSVRKASDDERRTEIDKKSKDRDYRTDERRPRLQQGLGNALVRYCQDFHAVLPFTDDEMNAEVVGSWAAEVKERLDGHELVQYEQQCNNAQQEMTAAFRDDLLHRLHDAFEGIKDTLNELNRHLKDRQFHGRDFYTFKPSPAASHADLIELVLESRRPDFQMPVFGMSQGEVPDTAIGRAIQIIERILRDPEARTEEIEDARQYFNFELYIHDEQGKIRSSLSSRTGTGSGGEGQLPFYIAIGASLAATYLNRRTEQMGLALAVFDEAFNRLDTKAIGACSDFLRDLGLQVVLAAPDEKRHVFMEVVDTVVNVNRVGDEAHISTEYLTEKTRRLLTEADPYRKGFAGFKAELVASGEAVANPQQEAAE